MLTGVKWCMVLMVVGAEPWQWPEAAESARVDTKVRFTDQDQPARSRYYQADYEDVPFQPAQHTEGFYNRAPGDGRYPVKDIRHNRRNSGTQLTPDGTLDSLHYCKCVSTPDCNFKMDSSACGLGQYLCCYNKPPSTDYHTSAVFNEVNGDPQFYPVENDFGPMSPGANGAFGPNGPKQVLVGPGGPTGVIGPNKPLFNGLDGTAKPVLVGPGGPTGIIGPVSDKRKKNVDVYDQGPNESAQRGVLVGPGGPTGIIGPAYNNRPILVGPGGPTGIIGPRRFPTYRNGILVGPGGPTGSIGPNRGVLVGPGGPTGRIGPWDYNY